MDAEKRLQTLEQVVLGVGTDNGLYREVKAMRAETRASLSALDAKLDTEREERKQEWMTFYSRLALWFVGAIGTTGLALLIDRLVS